MANPKSQSEVIAEAINDPNFTFMDTFADASEPEKVRKELTRLLFLHRESRNQLQVRERERVILNTKYESARRKAYMQHSKADGEKTKINEKTKLILVEIAVEKEKYDLEIMDQRIKELNRTLVSIKLEIDLFKTIGYSLKTEMGGF